MVQYDPKQFTLVVKRLDLLLAKDVENQGRNPAVVRKLAEFRQDPKTWLGANLNPHDYESICTPDWTKWTTYPE
jgi:hypothetical protein